jgi:hypothetical protein
LCSRRCGAGYFDLHNFRRRRLDAGPTHRHTFATFALRADVSTFDLSRYMGASLT